MVDKVISELEHEELLACAEEAQAFINKQAEKIKALEARRGELEASLKHMTESRDDWRAIAKRSELKS